VYVSHHLCTFSEVTTLWWYRNGHIIIIIFSPPAQSHRYLYNTRNV